ncbi:MAG: hypothetical protein WD312_01110 [Candidatus Paceibacterota bacterium]
MSFLRILLVGVLCSVATACSSEDVPSEHQGQETVAEFLELSGLDQYLSIEEFEKTNAQRRTVEGAEYYSLHFHSVISFKEDCYWHPSSISVVDFMTGFKAQRAGNTARLFNQELKHLQSFTPAFAGSETVFTGAVVFEKFESGWKRKNGGFMDAMDFPDYQEFTREANEILNQPPGPRAGDLKSSLRNHLTELNQLLQRKEGEEFINAVFAPHVIARMKEEERYQPMSNSFSSNTSTYRTASQRFRAALGHGPPPFGGREFDPQFLKGGDIAIVEYSTTGKFIFYRHNGRWVTEEI